MPESPKRYHPVHVTLHWLIALIVISALLYAKMILGRTPADSADKVNTLMIHVSIGGTLLILMIVRLITRFTLPRPVPATTGNRFLDFVAKAVHFLLYVMILTMLLSGLWLALQANLPAILFGDAPLPENFFDFMPRQIHGLVFLPLILLILLHFGAAMFHQFIKKDNLLSRMWYGK